MPDKNEAVELLNEILPNLQRYSTMIEFIVFAYGQPNSLPLFPWTA